MHVRRRRVEVWYLAAQLAAPVQSGVSPSSHAAAARTGCCLAAQQDRFAIAAFVSLANAHAHRMPSSRQLSSRKFRRAPLLPIVSVAARDRLRALFSPLYCCCCCALHFPRPGQICGGPQALFIISTP